MSRGERSAQITLIELDHITHLFLISDLSPKHHICFGCFHRCTGIDYILAIDGSQSEIKLNYQLQVLAQCFLLRWHLSTVQHDKSDEFVDQSLPETADHTEDRVSLHAPEI